MSSIDVSCPYCGRKIATVGGIMSVSKNTVCPNCKIRIKIDYDTRTGKVTTGRY